MRPHAVAAAAQWFHDNLKAQVFYAVKANPSRWVVETLVANGVKAFDVASLAEIALVRSVCPDVRLAFMHPVKSRSAIRTAYIDYGVRTFVLDSHDELQKIIDTTDGAEDLTLIVRMSVSAPGAAYALTGKFGVAPDQAPALLQAARQAVKDGQMGVSFHVGSQCMRPSAYEAAMTQAARAIKKAGVFVDIVDVGGGFPSVYPGMVPPDLSEYADAVHRGFREMPVGETSELWCEPGRALVAESTSVLCRVELRKDDALYLNDGSYGSLFDATHFKWPLPVRQVRLEQEANDERLPSLKPFRFYGPTCDSIDHMPGPFWLPADIQEGDFIEIGMMGAYGVAMSTGFNGHGAHEIAMVEDAPMGSMYGLAPRSIPTVRTTAEETARKIVRLPRARDKTSQRKRKR